MMQYLNDQQHDVTDQILSSLLKTHDFISDIGFYHLQLEINPWFDNDICTCLIGILIYTSKIVYIT
jgi:hypothetical protein